MRTQPKVVKKAPFDAAFWSRFSNQYWEKKPTHFKSIAPSILEVDAKQLFELLVSYSERCRASGSVTGLKFYVDGQPLYSDEILPLLPERKDKSLKGYHQRVSQYFSDYCLVCDELIQEMRREWGSLCVFMDGLYRNVGIPNRYAEIGLYLGNYKKTPFGVHIDGCGVFSVPVEGTKTFRLWDPSYVAKHPDLKESHHYTAYKKDSEVFVAKPGDITYWPSTYWHIAESDGSFSATWSIGLWLDKPYDEVLLETIKPFLSHQLQADRTRKSIPAEKSSKMAGQIKNLPPILSRSAKLLAHLSEGEWRDTLSKHWLEQLSRRAFKRAPISVKQKPLSVGESVRGIPGNPILWAQLSDGSYCVVVNGTTMDFKKTSGALKIIQTFNLGSVILVRKPAKEMLQQLFELHGIERV